MTGPHVIYTGDVIPTTGPVIFLAGPTVAQGRTPWRLDAIGYLTRLGYTGAIVVPEFEGGDFQAGAERLDWTGSESPIPGMSQRAFKVVSWEARGLSAATERGVVLFWMSFTTPVSDPRVSAPGMTTRAEFAHALARPDRLVAGMPRDAWNTAWIRYHAHELGVTLHETLAMTCLAAVQALDKLAAQPRPGHLTALDMYEATYGLVKTGRGDLPVVMREGKRQTGTVARDYQITDEGTYSWMDEDLNESASPHLLLEGRP